MSSESEPAKVLLPYLQRADELQKHEPLVAYYCRLYAMKRGFDIPQKERTKTTNALLVSLMKQREKDKKSVTLGPDDHLHIEGFALNIFTKADKQDRAGRADLNTTKTFYAASIFFEILNQFGALQPDIEQKQKYAAWKAADIRKALKEGRRPEPGPPGDDSGTTMPSSPSTNTNIELQSVEMEGMLAWLKKAMEEAQASKREAFQESQCRQQAEQEALEALRKAKIAEVLSAKDQRLRKEAESALSRERLELERLVKQHEDAMEELREMSVEKASLDRRITEVVHELEEKNQRLEDLLHTLDEMEREKLEMQRQMEDAMTKLEELSIRQEEFGEASRVENSFTEFSVAELVDATNGFDPGLKIGEGGFGTVYRGRIRYTTVAIKMLNSESMQGGSEFHQEVNALGRMRHPHLVTLIGACTEPCALVYEYLSNGSLEDRLRCKDSTAPLTWQARTSIAAEICSALLFLHSAGVVHGDLKPGNILLDAKLSAKIGDFGICRLLPEQDSTVGLYVTTNRNGTFAYMDPEFLATRQLTPLSDVYSFGVIILQLLTGRPALWISWDVQKAVSAGNLQAIIDPAAGDWPFVQAVQLANLGLECCKRRDCRPDLEKEVWRVLKPLKGSLPPSTHSMVTDSRQPPQYFICPIFQEIMRDPQVAADGFTYEAEALRGWLDSGHDTSPMTNLKLSHLNLTPNHALRSAIQEWCGHY